METSTAHVNGIDLHFHAAGEGPAIVLVHGFPQTSAGWTHQIPALAAAGFRVLAPDMRGYGRSTIPDDPAAYDADTIAADLTGLLDHIGERSAIFVGHDIGATMVWHLARANPDRVRAVAALSVPFAPRPTQPPTAVLRATLGPEHYLLLFQEPGIAEKILTRDVRRTLLTEGNWTRAWARSGAMPPRPDWLSEEELAAAVLDFTRTGFSGGLSYYRNFDRNWQLSARFADQKVLMPALFITGTEDIVRTFMPTEPMRIWVPNLQMITLDGAGHFIQQERPEQVNRALIDFATRTT
ncbi:alpha/beta fold hydrolase [Nocardia arthritidis]|uniref:alpha/beta fold hydrolase n=1 Tax=Nocardia arthritidis TaxID=228602 RepID=UPI00142D4E47|nr:alpha/beta hydrolase [Nocardia arthritidis]